MYGISQINKILPKEKKETKDEDYVKHSFDKQTGTVSLEQRFPAWGTRTPEGTQGISRGTED